MAERRRGARRAAAAVAVATALLGACAGDGGGAGPTEAQARAMLLRIDDVPAGFRAGPVPQPDRTTEEATDKMRTCNPHMRPAHPREPRPASPRFIDPTGRNIESFVSVMPSEAEAHEDVAAAQDAALMRCGVRVLYRPLSTEEPALRRIPVDSS